MRHHHDECTYHALTLAASPLSESGGGQEAGRLVSCEMSGLVNSHVTRAAGLAR